jgi:hypothetical protein
MRSSGSSPELVYALNEAGKLAHISEVVPGAACNCRCPNPACGKPLIAKVRQLKAYQNGKYRAQHFAHEADQACANAPESALHLLAKEVVEGELMLRLPEVKAVYRAQTKLLHKENEVRFTKAIPEAKELGSVIPDIYVERDGRLLLVVIFVTHACGQDKIAELKKKGIATVEVDLSTFPRDASRGEVKHGVLRTARRYWVFHPKIDAAVEEMRQETERRELAGRMAFNARIDVLVSAYDAGLNEIEAMRPPKFNRSEDISRLGLAEQIGLKGDGAGCFAVAPRVWQHSLLQHVFFPKDDAEAPSFRVKDLFDWFEKRKFIRSEFRYVAPEIEDALAARCIGFATPYRAIERYLDLLVKRGVLANDRGYSLAYPLQLKLGEMRHAGKVRAARKIDVIERVEKILQAIPDHERLGLTAARWLVLPQACGLSVQEAIDRDDARLSDTMRKVAAIEAMLFHRGKIAEESLALQLLFLRASESMGNHDSKVVDADSVD